jgi:uncharacterized membrane protein YjgN (DUF898 family)
MNESSSPQPIISPTTTSQAARIEFTGTGSEYFRIWIVNLLLTYVTFGIYSAWAKVRREKYFHQNTLVAGHSLDYHGKPFAILKGRLVAFVLFGVATSGISPWLAMAAFTCLLLMMPFFMQQSIRFRFANSSYRGIRFGFNGTLKDAYRTLAPFLLVPLLGGLFFINFNGDNASVDVSPQMSGVGIVILGFIALFSFPILLGLLHGAWRKYSLNNAFFGFVKGSTHISIKRYVWIYVSTALSPLLLGAIAMGILYSLNFFGLFDKNQNSIGRFAFFIPLLFLGLYLAYAFMQSIIPARIQNYCWHKATTVLTPNGLKLAEFESHLSLWKFGRLQIANIFLTLFTLGLYRPFAVVNTARAKLEAISLTNSRFIDFVISTENQNPSALGDEALDAFNLDFSI